MSGKLTSPIFSSVSDFAPESYLLEEYDESIEFCDRSSKRKKGGQWVLRNIQ